MRATIKEIKEQSKFVFMLAERLNEDVQSSHDEYLQFYTRYQNDAIRLRRELLKLNKMFNRDYR